MGVVGETLSPFSPPCLLILHCPPPALPAPKSDVSLEKSSGTLRLSIKQWKTDWWGAGSTAGRPGCFRAHRSLTWRVQAGFLQGWRLS